jgi:hypothetical protein
MSLGHVATDMGNADMSNAGGRAAPLTVDMSIDGMLDDSGGKFLQYDGAELPW